MSTNREFIKPCLENLEPRKVCSASWFGNAVMPRISNVLSRAAETRVPQTIKVQIISDAKAFETAWLNRVDNRVVGVLTADIRPMTNRTNILSVNVTYSGSFDGDSVLDDLARIRITKSVINLTSSFIAEVSSSGKWRPKGLKFRTDASCFSEAMAGPARGANWGVQMLTTDARAYSPRYYGISEAELVAASIRNGPRLVPTTVIEMARPVGNFLEKASRLAGPFADGISKAASQIRLALDFGSISTDRSDDAILADVKRLGAFTSFVGSQDQLNRFCSGGVTSILAYKKDLKITIGKIPVYHQPLAAVTYFGLISASAGLKGSVEFQVKASMVFLADSRGYGIGGGSLVSIETKASAGIYGNIAILGFEKWSVFSTSLEAGVYLSAAITIQVGDNPGNGCNYYFSSQLNKSPISDYCKFVATASAGAYMNTQVEILGIRVWERSKSWEKELYSDTIFEAIRQL